MCACTLGGVTLLCLLYHRDIRYMKIKGIHGVAVNAGECKDGDCLDAGDQPGGDVEVLSVASDGLRSPLEPGAKEPRQR